MYVWIWRHLPGTVAMKVLQTALLIAAVCALLLLVVFPWVDPHLHLDPVTVPGR